LSTNLILLPIQKVVPSCGVKTEKNAIIIKLKIHKINAYVTHILLVRHLCSKALAFVICPFLSVSEGCSD
jgi:hypothetical protein